jgi:hypothetical protein
VHTQEGQPALDAGFVALRPDAPAGL